MATTASRKAREKRIRAKYRRKIFVTGLIMLIIGLAAGYVLCMLTTDTPEPEVVTIESTPVIIEATPQIIEATPQVIEATPEIIYVTPEATAEPVVITVTPEPAVVTAEPVVATEAPTVEPTVEPAAQQATNVIETPLTATAATAEPVAVTAAPTAEPTAEPIVTGAEPIIVPYGEATSLNTQIKADGTARRSADAEAYETVNLTLQVDAHKGPNYFQSNYADSYMLQGNEAAVEFELTLNEYMGTAEIIPQNFLLITFRGETDADIIQGFQLMDTEIGGKTGISVYSDTPTTLYKRYPYSTAKDMVYMVVNTYNDGVEGTYWFEIIDPNPEPLYPASFEPLEEGSKGDEVEKLQQKLIDMGLLDDKADGKFGKKTGEAVSACQELLGLEPTGYADAALMNALFDIM